MARLHILLILLAVSRGASRMSKTKKYKCILVGDDEPAVIKQHEKPAEQYSWRREDEELRPIGSAHFGPAEPAPLPASSPAFSPPSEPLPPSAFPAPPSAAPQRVEAVTSSFISPMEVPRDHRNQPLILSPQHCQQVKHYASMYGVRDVLNWVKSNCAFARMYLPNATCEEINILVGSCYPEKAGSLPAPPPPTPPLISPPPPTTPRPLPTLTLAAQQQPLALWPNNLLNTDSSFLKRWLSW